MRLGKRPSSGRLVAGGFVLMFAALVLVGCASTGETGQSDAVTANVGSYSAPPANAPKPRVAVPQFAVESSGWGGQDLDSLASDQMTSLLHQSRRFSVVERGQLEQLLREQDMEGIVRPGELAKPGEVRGVQYLLLGKVTNFRIKAERTDKGVGVNPSGKVLGKIGDTLGGGASINRSNVRINTEAGVDLRLVDPSTGEVWVAHFGDFKRTDTASGMGLGLGGFDMTGEAEIQVTRDDAGKVLRLALDEALRKMLPEIDEKLAAMGPMGGSPSAGTPAMNGIQPSSGAQQPVAAKKFCGQCGAQITSPDAKFCPGCGAAVQ